MDDNNSHRTFSARKKPPVKKSPPSAMSWIGDGIDHINIGRDAETEFGKLLQNESEISLRHSIFGTFSSVMCFWYYIQSVERDDRIRKLTGHGLSRYIKRLTPARIRNFRAIIIDASYQRIYQTDELYHEMMQSKLPFDCYTVNESGIRIRNEYAHWLSSGMEEIRNALRNNREPDFSRFKDDRAVDTYFYVLPKNTRVI
jgi:hypothetical protein